MDLSESILQASGLKRTRARISMLELLKDQDEPLDVPMIMSLLKKNKIAFDQATVYRFLDILTKRGIVTKLEFGEGKFRYEFDKGDHHHLICENCGGVSDVEDNFMASLEKEIKNKTGFRVKSHNLEFFGVCKKCQD